MPIPDDSRRKTRVYHREQEQRQTRRRNERDERIGFTQPITPRRRALDGISAAQVVAGAAAAATSMLLASKIGIAGSVIGAAVSSAVTIVCSQLYRHALETSAEKLKLSQLGIAGDSSHMTAADAYRSGGASASRRSARIAPAALQIRAAEERWSTQRKVLVASIALAVATVALTAGIILLGTADQGLGTRPASLLPTASQQQPAAGQTAAGTGPDTGSEPNAPVDSADNESASGAEEDGSAGTGQAPAGDEGELTPSEPMEEGPSADGGVDPDGSDADSSSASDDSGAADIASGTADSPSANG